MFEPEDHLGTSKVSRRAALRDATRRVAYRSYGWS